MKVRHELRVNGFLKRRLGDVRPIVRDFVYHRTAEIRRHENHAVAKIDLSAFSVTHRATVEHLIKDVQHIAVGLFHFVEQHDTIRSLTYRFGQHAAAAVAYVARWRAFELRNRDDRPVASNGSPEGQARNRRTEIVIVGETEDRILGK